MSSQQAGQALGSTVSIAAAQADYVDGRARGEYIRLAIGCFLVAFMNAHSTLLSLVYARAGFDLHDTGLLLTAIAPPVIFFALASSEVSARIGTLWTVRLAMLLIVAGMIVIPVAQNNFWTAWTARFVQGAGQGLFLSSVITYAQSRLTPRKFVFLLGVLSSTMPLTQAIAPPFGEWALARWGETATFVGLAVPALIGVALTFTLRPLAGAPRARGLDLLASWRPSFVEPLAAVVINGAMFGVTTAWFAPALHARGAPLWAFFTVSSVTMFSTRLLALRGVDSIDRRFLVAMGLGLLAVGYLAVAFSGGALLPVIFGGLAFGTGYSLTYPVLSAWMSDGLPPERRAGPQAWLNGFFNLGLFVTPLPATWLIAATSYETMMVALAVCAAAFALWMAARAATGRSAADAP